MSNYKDSDPRYAYPRALLERSVPTIVSDTIRVVFAKTEKDKASKLKQYILIKDSIDDGHAVLTAAHASLAGYLEWKGTDIVEQWLKHSFRKVVCRVTAAEFEAAKDVPDHRVMIESGLAGMEVAIVFKPREVWHKSFKFFKLWK